MSSVCVCMLVCGTPNYYRAANRSIQSILKRSPFDIHIACDMPEAFSQSKRIKTTVLDFYENDDRARPFLLKFEALSGCLQNSDAEWILMLDADTLLAMEIQEQDVRRVLHEFPLGMVEQTGIRGSTMSRSGFLEHYKNYTLAWFDPKAAAPGLEDFRFFNSGVVLGHRAEFEKIIPWALRQIRSATNKHEVGIHMIADQDYLQYWTNTLHPGSCESLPWNWNHCEHWDMNFPRKGAIFYHLSNFCNGPTRRSLFRMAWLDMRARHRSGHANF